MAIRRAPLPVVWFDIDILLSVSSVAAGREITAAVGVPMVVAARNAEVTSRRSPGRTHHSHPATVET